MNLVSQLLFAVIISTLTSSLLLVVWRMLRIFFITVNPKLINVALRMVCVTYLLPIGYLAILLSEHQWLEGQIRAWKLQFARTRHITKLVQILAIVWIIIAGFRILKRILQNMVWCRKLEDNIPIEGEIASEVFCKVCEELDIQEGKVSLQRNPLMKFPMIVRGCKPQVLLPEQDYTEQELELIFYHELSHYKHHDLNWKVFVIIITMIQDFNPLVYPLLAIVSFWGECMADVSALEASGNLYSAKQYFAKIEKLMPESTDRKKDKYLFAALYRNDKTMVRRVEFVQCYQHANKCSRRAAAGLLTAFLIISIMLAVEVGIHTADLYKFIYRMTENNSEIRIAMDGIEEHYIDEKGWIWNQHSDSILSETNQMDDGSYSCLNLKIKPDAFCLTSNFKVEAGQSVDVSAGVRCFWADYWVGILYEDGCVCYVQAEGFVSHIFSIEKTGKCCIFVKNNRSEEEIPYIVVNYKLIDGVSVCQ